MSLKRVVLIAAVVLLTMPAAALADGLNFGFTTASGVDSFALNRSTGSFVLGSTASTTANVPILTYLSRMTGNAPFGPSVPPTFGIPPTMVFPGTPLTNDFGTVAFTTGAMTSFTGLSSAVFAGGGSVTLTSGGTLGTATGGAIPNGTTIFSGAFSGPTTLTQFVGGTPSNFPGCRTTVRFCYILSGPISGTLAPSVLSYFALGNSAGSNGLILSLAVGFNDSGATPDNTGNIEAGLGSVVVPEPGTLALFGTGLIAVAGFIRRRAKA